MNRMEEFARKYGLDIFCCVVLFFGLIWFGLWFFAFDYPLWLAVVLGFSMSLSSCIWLWIVYEAFMIYIWRGIGDEKISKAGRLVRLSVLLGSWSFMSLGLIFLEVDVLLALLVPAALLVLIAPTAAMAKIQTISGDDNYDPMIGSW